MRTEAVQFVFALLALAFGSAAECLLPKALGVGFPALLAATAFFAPRRGVLPAVCFALVAGAAEDALSGLPFTVSAAFFTMTAAAARGKPSARGWARTQALTSRSVLRRRSASAPPFATPSSQKIGLAPRR